MSFKQQSFRKGMKELSGFFKSFKKFLSKVFIDGLSGMALGLFATLIVGTIIQQIGQLIPGSIGELIFLVGKTAAALTGAGIGVGVVL